MSMITRDRRNLLIAAAVALIGIGAALAVTLGLLSGAQAVTGIADGVPAAASSSDPTATPSPAPSAAAVPSSSVSTPASSASATTKPATPKPSATTAKPKVAAAALPARSGNDRRVTFVNKTKQTIWVAGWQQTPKPALKKSGWVLKAGKSLTITVADKWNGRFWGRTGCTFNSAGKGHCVTGDCAGRFQCTGYGAIPATLAEYNFNAWQHLDFYDVSLVDGSNLPMWINHTGGSTKDAISSKGCSSAGCTKAVPCPKVLKVDGGAGCESPCAKLGGDQYCCAGKWAPRSECDPTKWPVNYAAIFKKAEPFAYSYVDDDATSTFTCKGRCDYRITFGLTPA
jgi:hypothetical protein